MNIDWGSTGVILTIVFGILGVIAFSKINIMNIKPKNKEGDIDMSNSEYTMEKHIHKPKKKDK